MYGHKLVPYKGTSRLCCRLVTINSQVHPHDVTSAAPNVAFALASVLALHGHPSDRIHFNLAHTILRFSSTDGPVQYLKSSSAPPNAHSHAISSHGQGGSASRIHLRMLMPTHGWAAQAAVCELHGHGGSFSVRAHFKISNCSAPAASLQMVKPREAELANRLKRPPSSSSRS